MGSNDGEQIGRIVCLGNDVFISVRFRVHYQLLFPCLDKDSNPSMMHGLFSVSKWVCYQRFIRVARLCLDSNIFSQEIPETSLACSLLSRDVKEKNRWSVRFIFFPHIIILSWLAASSCQFRWYLFQNLNVVGWTLITCMGGHLPFYNLNLRSCKRVPSIPGIGSQSSGL